jgi:hypothetical protein
MIISQKHAKFVSDLREIRDEIVSNGFSLTQALSLLELTKECIDKNPWWHEYQTQCHLDNQERTLVSLVIVLVEQISCTCRERISFHQELAAYLLQYKESSVQPDSKLVTLESKCSLNESIEIVNVKAAHPIRFCEAQDLSIYDSCSLPFYNSPATLKTPTMQISLKRKTIEEYIPEIEDEDYDEVPKRKRITKTGATSTRTNFSKHAIQTLKSWLFNNKNDPYPSELEKQTLSAKTSMTINQINNWFINARRRHLRAK